MLCFNTHFSSLLGNANSPLPILSSSLNDSNALNPKTEGTPAARYFLILYSVSSVLSESCTIYLSILLTEANEYRNAEGSLKRFSLSYGQNDSAGAPNNLSEPSVVRIYAPASHIS